MQVTGIENNIRTKSKSNRLVTDQGNRLEFEDLIKHPFFRGIDWQNIRSTNAAIVPTVTSKTDTRNFDQFEPQPVRNLVSRNVYTTISVTHTYASNL